MAKGQSVQSVEGNIIDKKTRKNEKTKEDIYISFLGRGSRLLCER